jgi:hypothetical protein
MSGDRQPVGQPTGSSPAGLREGASFNGRTLHADAYQTLTMGAEYIGDDNACGAIKKDGTYCSASKVKTRERCIGHLRGSQEGE